MPAKSLCFLLHQYPKPISLLELHYRFFYGELGLLGALLLLGVRPLASQLVQPQYVYVLLRQHVEHAIQQLLFQPLIELRVVLPQPFHVVHVQLQNVLFLPPHGSLFQQLHVQCVLHVLAVNALVQLCVGVQVQPARLHIFHEQQELYEVLQ